MGVLKTAINHRAKEFGIYICGGRGKHSRKTPEELLEVADKTGLDGHSLMRSSWLTAKIDNTTHPGWLSGFTCTPLWFPMRGTDPSCNRE